MTAVAADRSYSNVSREWLRDRMIERDKELSAQYAQLAHSLELNRELYSSLTALLAACDVGEPNMEAIWRACEQARTAMKTVKPGTDAFLATEASTEAAKETFCRATKQLTLRAGQWRGRNPEGGRD